MLRPNHPANAKVKKEKFNLVLNNGGLGDAIARLTVAKYLADNAKHLTIYAWVPDYIVELAKHCLNDQCPNLIFKSFDKAKTEFNSKFPGRNIELQTVDTFQSHIVDSGMFTICNTQVENKDRNYVRIKPELIDISKFSLPEKYVVVTTGFTASVREWLPKHVNQVVKYLKFKGYEVVFLGKKQVAVGGAVSPIQGAFKEEIDYSQGINLIDQTGLLEAAKICGEAKAVVGLDNGLIHLAATTDVPIVCGFTTVEPRFREPIRHNQPAWNFYSVVPEESLACRFCQTKSVMIFEHDFRNCFYKDELCKEQLVPSKWIEQLEKIL